MTLGPRPGESIVTRRTVNLDALARNLALMSTPVDQRASCAFYPCAFDTAFELYRWAEARAVALDDRRVIDAVRNRHGAVSVTESDPFVAERPTKHWAWRRPLGWRDDLRERLLRILLADWLGPLRTAIGIEPLRPLRLVALQHEGANISEELDALFALATERRRLIVSPNQFHQRARKIVSVALHASPAGWAVQMAYGLGGSVWYDGRARHASWRAPNPLRPERREGESFLTFIRRARRELEALLVPVESCDALRGVAS